MRKVRAILLKHATRPSIHVLKSISSNLSYNLHDSYQVWTCVISGITAVDITIAQTPW